MRRFFSYGPLNTKVNYYAPRQQLIERTLTRLVGEVPEEGGHYITVWPPRQTGKSWLMQQILLKLRQHERFDVVKVNLEHLKFEQQVGEIINTVAEEVGKGLKKSITGITTG
jgi:predicted AAA+ superfamily ATPase